MGQSFRSKFQKLMETTPGLGFVAKFIKHFPGAEIYLVGGAVRDILLDRQTKDFDFVVRLVEAEKLQSFLKSLGQVNLVGKHFGVFKFSPKGLKDNNPIDIAFPRKEHSLKLMGIYRDFKIQSDPRLEIEADLERRDFTINALAWDIKNQRLIDRFQGLKDLEDRLIRAVGDPTFRFREDYSRMLRGIRFACELNFEMERKTWLALKKMIGYIGDSVVPRETVAKEFLKSLRANPLQTIDFYDLSGAFRCLMPEVLNMKNCPQPRLFHKEGDVFVHTRLCFEKFTSNKYQSIFDAEPRSSELLLGVLLHDIGKPDAITTPEKDGTDRIRFHGHDVVGATIANHLIKRLKLESTGEIKADRVVWLIHRHLLLLQANVNEIRPATIEKYFFNDQVPGRDLLKLILVDGLASVPLQGEPNIQNVKLMLERIKEIKKMSKKGQAPAPLLDGKEIMKKFKLKSGPQIGDLLSLIREAQLEKKISTKEQAFDLLSQHLK